MAPKLEEFNEDELVAPAWLNNEFFQDVLRHCEKNADITIKKLKLTPGSAKGDHYASIMFRGVVDYQQGTEMKQKSMIIKTMPEVEGHKKDFLGESHIFETEIAMYTEILPKFEQILRTIGDNTVLKAPCLYHMLKPRKVIVFEDIVPMGYSVIRERSITLEEVKTAYLKIAKWHAISYKLNKEDPKYFENYPQISSVDTTVFQDPFLTGGMRLFVDFLKNTPSLTQFYPHFEAMQADYYEKFLASYKEYRENPQENAYYVLCHGDFHCRNVMVKHADNTKKLQDLMLLDFQVCYIGPIVNDICNSIFMLLTADMRANMQDELLYYYFSNFRETLQKLGYSGELPKMVEFKAQFVRHKYILMFYMVTLLPLWNALDDGADLNEMFSSEACRRKLYDNEKFIKEMEIILPKYLHLGYLEN